MMIVDKSRVGLIVASVGLLLIMDVSCGHKSSPQGAAIVDTNGSSYDAIYVCEGGTGDGTRQFPLGSIQAAIDTVSARGDRRTVFVATGNYHESVQIQKPLDLIGGLDSLTWTSADSGQTVIWGTRYSGLITTVLVDSVDSTVRLRNIRIQSENGVDAGECSIGAMVRSCSRVYFDSCVVAAGDGAPGQDGLPGIDGTNGAAGQQEFDGYFTPGLTPVPGGHGGSGGMAELYVSNPGLPGEPGWCAADSGAGGAGGTSSSFQGQSGQQGVDGTDGVGAAGSKMAMGAFGFVLDHGAGSDGTAGGSGCGGGGGHGGPSEFTVIRPEAYYGAHGGGGGAGAAGGTPGTGGTAGGCSIALACVNSNISVRWTTVSGGAGGKGGEGGSGGRGGAGGAGGASEHWPVRAGEGGKGGDGGRGGTGGGGAGGWSICILGVGSMSGCQMVGEQFITGVAGIGGGPGAVKGENGRTLSGVYQLSE